MFQSLGLIVNLVPLHAEHFAKHALDQVVAQRETPRDLPSGRRQADLAVSLHPDKAVFLQTTHGHGDRRRRYLEPVRKRGGNHRLAFTLGLENGLEIIFF